MSNQIKAGTISKDNPNGELHNPNVMAVATAPVAVATTPVVQAVVVTSANPVAE